MIREASTPTKTTSPEKGREMGSVLRRGLPRRRRASKTGRFSGNLVQMNPNFLVRLASQRKIMLPESLHRRTPVQR